MCKGRGPRFACQTLGSVVGSKQSGIFVHTRGVLTCENDNIFQNAKAGVQVKNTGQVFATKNVIRKNGHVGIWIYEGGNGSLIHNDLRFNERGGLKLEKDAGSVRLGHWVRPSWPTCSRDNGGGISCAAHRMCVDICISFRCVRTSLACCTLSPGMSVRFASA